MDDSIDAEPEKNMQVNNAPLISNQRTIKSPQENIDLFQAQLNQRGNYTKKAPVTRRNINHYVRGIMQDIVDNLEYVNDKTPLAVSSFVFLDDDYSDGSLLGNQIAESFMH